MRWTLNGLAIWSCSFKPYTDTVTQFKYVKTIPVKWLWFRYKKETVYFFLCLKESQALRSSLAITMKVFICSILLVAVVQGNPKDRFI